MAVEICLSTVKSIEDLHDYLHAELRLRRVPHTLQALGVALTDARCTAEIEFTDYGKISGALLDYVNQMIECIVLANEKNPNVSVMITI